MSTESLFINIDFVQTKMSRLIVQPQHIEATITGLAKRMSMIVFTRRDEGVDVLWLYLNIDPHHEHALVFHHRGC